jgi:hypothetical protein
VAPASAAAAHRCRPSSDDYSRAAPPAKGSTHRPASFSPARTLNRGPNRPIGAPPELYYELMAMHDIGMMPLLFSQFLHILYFISVNRK